jgi:hypothetical protein
MSGTNRTIAILSALGVIALAFAAGYCAVSLDEAL